MGPQCCWPLNSPTDRRYPQVECAYGIHPQLCMAHFIQPNAQIQLQIFSTYSLDQIRGLPSSQLFVSDCGCAKWPPQKWAHYNILADIVGGTEQTFLLQLKFLCVSTRVKPLSNKFCSTTELAKPMHWRTHWVLIGAHINLFRKLVPNKSAHI